VAEIAKGERINKSYVSRIRQLALLVPDLVKAILASRLGPNVKLTAMLVPVPPA
jgi:hypothetical protein